MKQLKESILDNSFDVDVPDLVKPRPWFHLTDKPLGLTKLINKHNAELIARAYSDVFNEGAKKINELLDEYGVDGLHGTTSSIREYIETILWYVDKIPHARLQDDDLLVEEDFTQIQIMDALWDDRGIRELMNQQTKSAKFFIGCISNNNIEVTLALEKNQDNWGALTRDIEPTIKKISKEIKAREYNIQYNPHFHSIQIYFKMK